MLPPVHQACASFSSAVFVACDVGACMAMVGFYLPEWNDFRCGSFLASLKVGFQEDCNSLSGFKVLH